MPEETTGVTEQETTETTETQESTEPTADSSVEEIQSYLESQEEAESSEESPSSETEQSDTSGEDEKTQEEEVGTSEKSDDEVEEGSPIPYDRFKQVNEKAKTYESENEQLRADLDEAQNVLKDPEVLGLVLKKRGYTDEKIAEYFKEQGIERVQPQKTEYDLQTVEGWQTFIRDEIKKANQPLQQTLTEQQKQQQQAQHAKWVGEQEELAKEVAKDKYGLEFGTISKDENNPNTAVGIMWDYLQKNPDDAKLGYVKILKLAMSDKAVAKGKEEGRKEEKKRQEKVKAAAMEGDASVVSEETPQADWSVEKIQAWCDAHPNME